MYQPPQLTRDATGRCKLVVTLPGGRYQLSLDDRAVNILMDDLGLGMRDTVPAPFVPIFVAVGDAWFPSERDTDAIIEDLRSSGALTDAERDVLMSYVTESLIPERNATRVERAVSNSPIADDIDPDDFTINSLPEIPEWSTLSESSDGTTAAESSETTDAESAAQAQKEAREESTQKVEEPSSPSVAEDDQVPDSEAIEALQEIPGIGTTRAESFVEVGVTSLSDIADSRPVSLAAINGISKGIAAVAVEGAREVLGQEAPTSERLAEETATESDVFEPTLRSLAASGIPATEAAPTLRLLYGPTVADIDAVTGEQAYHLWEAGYRTPHEVVEATVDELTDVYQVGDATASKIRESAREHVEATRN